MPQDEFRKALDTADVLEITFTGRKTGKKFTAPVWFVKESNKLYLLPVMGTSSKWFKSVLANPTMELRLSGKKATAAARPINDKRRVDETVERFRTKYGADDVKRYYPKQNAAVELSI